MNINLLQSIADQANLNQRPQWDEQRQQQVVRLSPDQLAFAEAIVQECVKIIDSTHYNGYHDRYDAGNLMAIALQKHFQVKS